MKYINTFLIFGMISILLTSCYKEEDWLEDNIKEGGIYFPVLQNIWTETESAYTQGSTAVVHVQYWSRDDVKTVDLYQIINGGDATLVSSNVHTDNYDEESGAQIMKLNYQISATDTVGTMIDLRAVVNTVNDLSKEKSTTITIE